LSEAQNQSSRKKKVESRANRLLRRQLWYCFDGKNRSTAVNFLLSTFKKEKINGFRL